ncbi:MAG TPA: carbohydrate porin [Candidatus Obscuribacterales bacterium]
MQALKWLKRLNVLGAGLAAILLALPGNCADAESAQVETIETPETVETAKPVEMVETPHHFDLYGEIVTMLQGGYDAAGKAGLSAPTRLRLELTTNILPGQLSFVTRAIAAAGAFNLGNGELVPINLMATVASRNNEPGRPNLMLDKAHFQWKPLNELELEFGLMNLFNHEIRGQGFDNNAGTSEESRCFTSGHFIGALAPGKYFLPSLAPSLYALTARYDPFDFLSLKAGLATSDPANLLQLNISSEEARAQAFNSAMLQLTGSFSPFDLPGHYRLGYGLVTRPPLSGESLTPGNAGYFNFDQKIHSNLLVFGRYSLAQDNATNRAVPFDGIQQHIQIGLGYASGAGIPFIADDYAAIGFSAAQPFAGGDGDTFEKVIEVFWRHKLFERFSLTPDLQLVIHPQGKSASPIQTIAALRAFYEF